MCNLASLFSKVALAHSFSQRWENLCRSFLSLIFSKRLTSTVTLNRLQSSLRFVRLFSKFVLSGELFDEFFFCLMMISSLTSWVRLFQDSKLLAMDSSTLSAMDSSTLSASTSLMSLISLTSLYFGLPRTNPDKLRIMRTNIGELTVDRNVLMVERWMINGLGSSGLYRGRRPDSD